MTSRSASGTGTSLLFNIHPCAKRHCLRSILNRRLTKRVRRTTQKWVIVLGTAAVVSTAAGVVMNLSDKRKNRTVREREQFNFDKHVLSIGDDHFQRLYRLTRQQFNKMCHLISPILSRRVKRNTDKAATVPVEVMLCVTLRILAGASYLDVGWPYGIGSTTTYQVFTQTLHALNQCLDPIIFPQSESECREEANRFRRNRRSPLYGIIAALDGIAIAIQQPRLLDTPDPRKYYNRKGFFAICVQAAVAANYKFLFVSARHAGSTHDSTAFQSTKLAELLLSNTLPQWSAIAADDAYKNGSHILTPYSGRRLTLLQDSFNYYLSSLRITVEQAFGILVTRFGIFWSPLRFDLAKDTLIILVACKIHNFIIDNSVGGRHSILPMAEENRVQGEPVVHLQSALHTDQEYDRNRNRSREHSPIRDKIAERLNQLGFIRPPPSSRHPANTQS